MLRSRGLFLQQLLAGRPSLVSPGSYASMLRQALCSEATSTTPVAIDLEAHPCTSSQQQQQHHHHHHQQQQQHNQSFLSPLGLHQFSFASTSAPPVLRWPQHLQRWWHASAATSTAWHPHLGQMGGSQLQQARGAKSKVLVDYEVMKEPKYDTYSGKPNNYIQLLLALKYAPNIARLRHLVDEYGLRFDAPHASAALTRLPKVARFRDEQLRQEVVSSAPPGTDPESLEAAAKLGPRSRMLPVPGAQVRKPFRDAASALTTQLLFMVLGQERAKLHPDVIGNVQLSKRALKGLNTRFTERNAANVMWALGTLHRHGVQVPPRLRSTTANTLLKVFADSSRKAGSKQREVAESPEGHTLDIVQLVSGLSKLQLQPQKMWAQYLLQDLATELARNAHYLGAQELQAAFHGFAFLGYAPRFLVNALAERITQIPRDFTPQGIATLMRLLAPRSNPSGLTPIASTHVQPTHPPTQTQQASSTAAPQQHSSDASTPETVATGPGFELSVPPALQGPRIRALQALADGIPPQLMSVTREDLAGVAQAIASLGSAFRLQANPLASTGNAATNSMGDQTLPVAHGVPSWLASLAQMMSRKACSMLDQLQPLQLAAVLDMVAALELQDRELLQKVADGILAEQQLDPNLPVPAAVSLIRAFCAMDVAGMEEQQVAQQRSTEGSTIASSAYAEREPQVMGTLPSAPRVRGEGWGAPEATQLHLLRFEPLSVRASTAVHRVLSNFTQPGAIQSLSSADVAALAGALALLHSTRSMHSTHSTLDTDPLVEQLVARAEALLLPPAGEGTELETGIGGTVDTGASGGANSQGAGNSTHADGGSESGSVTAQDQSDRGAGRSTHAEGVSEQRGVQAQGRKGVSATMGDQSESRAVGGGAEESRVSARGVAIHTQGGSKDLQEEEGGGDREEEEGQLERVQKMSGAARAFGGRQLGQLGHLMRALNAVGVCSAQLAIAALHHARDSVSDDPKLLPTASEVAFEALSAGAPADASTAVVLSEAYMAAMASAHNVQSTESGLATPNMRQQAGELGNDDSAGGPGLSVSQLGQMLAFLHKAGGMSDELQEAAAEQLLLQLPPGVPASPANAHALAQCLALMGTQELEGRRASALDAICGALLQQGVLTCLEPADLESVLDSASKAQRVIGKGEELVHACKRLLQ